MKQLAEIIRSVRQSIVSGFKIVKSETSRTPLELVEETTSISVEIPGERVHEISLRKLTELQGEIYALDSSSRVVETPYVFTSIGAGSVYNRFTGYAIDVPSLASILGLEEPLCKHVVIIPEVGPPGNFHELVESSKSIMSTNPISVPYTSSYNKSIILAELRASIENCLLEKYSEVARHGSVLFVDGPLVYPEKVVEATSTSRELLDVYASSMRALNRQRVMLIERLLAAGTLVVNLVKRLHKSFYLSTIDPLGLGISGVSDETYLATALLTRKVPVEKPISIGPIIIKQYSELGASKAMWYVVIPRRPHTGIESVGNYVFYRVEVPEKCVEKPVIDLVARDSIQLGSYLPLTLLVADRRVKKLSSSITTYFLYLTGLTSEATEHYISTL
ncbi:MAG: DNA double-strand break repair nuclease NurA [Desulfurococcaceae archaeon]|nr:DNA double-strand break repair nuclease NurA [Desulfurococcaceae archaeon]